MNREEMRALELALAYVAHDPFYEGRAPDKRERALMQMAIRAYTAPALTEVATARLAAESGAEVWVDARKDEPVRFEIADTLPEWLHNRFGSRSWGDLSEDDRDYWRHEAEAVRRAVARGGFKVAGAQGGNAGWGSSSSAGGIGGPAGGADGFIRVELEP